MSGQSWSGHTFWLVGPRTVELSGKSALRFVIPPLAEIQVKGEFVTRNSPFFDCVPNLNRRFSYNPWGIPDAMPPESLKLYRMVNGRRSALRADRDYRLDNPSFGGIKFLKPEKFAADDVFMDYQVRYQRVDCLAADDAGTVRLFCGKESLVCARIPLLPAGWNAICRIYSHRCAELGEDDLLPVSERRYGRLLNYEMKQDAEARMPDDWFGAAQPEHPDAIQLYTRQLDYRAAAAYAPAAAEALRRRLREQKQFTLVYFGDSVTMGGDVPNDLRFPRRLNGWLQKQYPQIRFNCPNSSIGGTNSTCGRERFAADVLAYHPDAVTVMFPLNDHWMADADWLTNHRYFVDGLRKINAIPIFMTSNAMTRSWSKNFDHTIDRIRTFCADEKIILIDVYRLWTLMKDYGIPYETLLANGINHPDSVATGMFFEALKRLFGGNDL